jgi:hypothetical protein
VWQRKNSQIVGLAGKCLDVLGQNVTSGTTVDLASCWGTPGQNWRIINPPVTLQGLAGHCLDVLSGNAYPGARVDNATCNGTKAQILHLNADGTLINYWGYCLDVRNADYQAGVLQFTTCNGTAAQQWEQIGDQIVGLAGECLDVLDGNSAPGATVHLTACNGRPRQNWQAINAPTVLQSSGSKCLDIINGSTKPGARLQIFECNRGTNAQLFTFTAAGEIRNTAGECLDANAGGQVQIAQCSGSPSQKWNRQGSEIRGPSDGISLSGNCLGTVGGFQAGAQELQSGKDHTPVGLVPCDGTAAQQWVAADLYQHGPATLLIITSDAFASEFASFLGHKQAIGVSIKLLTMKQVHTDYPASDDALSLKYAIEDHYRNFGTKYVLLGGDNSQVPLRYSRVLDGGKHTTHSFRISDLYYANLYSGHRPGSGFHSDRIDTWDSNGNGYYNETSWDNPTDNPDNVDGFPDIAVGRIPAYDTTSLAAILA